MDATGIEERVNSEVGRSLRVFPNPVTEQASISYNLPHGTAVSCVVYDAAGNQVSRLAVGTQAAGVHKLTWSTADVRPGIYFCKLVAGNTVSTVRLVRVR